MQVPLSEAIRLLKISDKTARRWLRNGKLKGSQVSTDKGLQWLVDIPDNLPEEPSSELETLRGMNSLLRQRLDAADHELESKNRQIEQLHVQIGQLHVLLQQAQAALPSPKSTPRPWWQFWRQD
jgi:predicted site-specific integrase-resolvase